MVVLERIRNEQWRTTDLYASCSACGWRSTSWLVAVTDGASASLNSIEEEYAARANAAHVCMDKKGSR